MKCNRCDLDSLIWNDADYLVCMNCGKIIIEPKNKSEIVQGLMLYSTMVKERLWKLRCSGGKAK